MNLPVVWSGPALEQLAALWDQAADRAAITAASDRLDNQLRSDPFGAGESREFRVRIVFDPPLAALYQLDPSERRVLVLQVGLSRRLR